VSAGRKGEFVAQKEAGDPSMNQWTKFFIASAVLATITGILIYARAVHAVTPNLTPFALPRA